MRLETLHSRALASLTQVLARSGGPVLSDIDDVLQVTASDDLAAAVALDSGYWREARGLLGDPLLACVPDQRLIVFLPASVALAEEKLAAHEARTG